MSTRELAIRLAKCQVDKISYSEASQSYPRLTNDILDSMTGKTNTPANSMNWGLVCERCPDPPGTDVDFMTSYFAANSHIFLKATCGGLIRYEEIIPPPKKYLDKFAVRAKSLRAERLRAEALAQPHEEQEPHEPDQSLLAHLTLWLERNPQHDAALAKIAEVVLRELTASAD